MTLQRILRCFCFASILALGISGCLEEQTTAIVHYDKNSDYFEFFVVYERFRSKPALFANLTTQQQTFEQDLAQVRAMWAARERSVHFDDPFGGLSFLTLSADRKGVLDAEPQPGDVPVPWDTVQIKPGKLFEDRDGFLGYWHEARIPGRVIDQVLANSRSRIAGSQTLPAVLNGELTRRAASKPPPQPADWNELSKWLDNLSVKVGAVTKPTAKAEANDAASPDMQIIPRVLACLDDQSLTAMLHALETGDFGHARRGATVQFRLPLTDRDSQGITDLSMHWKGCLKLGLFPELAMYWKLVANRISIRVDKGLMFSMDIASLLSGIADDSRDSQAKSFHASPDSMKAAATFARMAEHWQDVPIEHDVDPAELIKRFNAKIAREK